MFDYWCVLKLKQCYSDRLGQLLGRFRFASAVICARSVAIGLTHVFEPRTFVRSLRHFLLKFFGRILNCPTWVSFDDRGSSVYIYLYIYCHPQRDCFVLSELFSVARQARFLKVGSKPGWLKRQDSTTLPRGDQRKRRKLKRLCITFVYIYPLNGYQELNSFEEPSFTLVATITSLVRELTPPGVGEHIYCHLCIYIYIYIVRLDIFSMKDRIM